MNTTHYKNLCRANAGLTLIELMVVLAVLATIAAVAVPAYRGYIKTSYRAECQNEVAAIRLAQEEYFLENNQYFPAGGGESDGILAIQADSGNLYKSSYGSDVTKINNANCTYKVTSYTTPAYNITATGANKLSGESTIVEFSK
jgi:type IV pilus assembly protein PilE